VYLQLTLFFLLTRLVPIFPKRIQTGFGHSGFIPTDGRNSNLFHVIHVGALNYYHLDYWIIYFSNHFLMFSGLPLSALFQLICAKEHVRYLDSCTKFCYGYNLRVLRRKCSFNILFLRSLNFSGPPFHDFSFSDVIPHQ